jgi:RNA-binding protein
MSSTIPVGYIDIRVFSHATEDPEKVLIAVRNTLPIELAEIAVFQKTSLTGHHGNPIILFETRLNDKKVLPAVIKKISSELTSVDKETLSENIKMHLERRNLFLRFDKQSAFLGELRFSSNDPIHFKIHFRNKNSEEIMMLCRESGLLL